MFHLRALFSTSTMGFLACIMFLLLALFASPTDAFRRRFNPVSRHAIQPQHSLSTPTDQSQVYWSFGGSTALTKKFARIVPATQNRRGWLWNEYPMETNRFEVEIVYEIGSRPHFGGEGFGVWFVSPKDNSGSDVESINGPFFGMNEDFTGVGVIFDVYDNDGRRNNPMISVLQNDGTRARFSPEKDFEDDIIRTLPSTGSYRPDAYRCQADIRNLGRKVRTLIKIQEGILHVYNDTEDGNGWKLCLGVDFGARGGKFPSSLKDMHLAITASTGQVADAVDIYEINTRYLLGSASATAGLNGDEDQFEYSETNSDLTQWSLFLLVVTSLGLFGLSFNDFSDYRNMMNSRLDSIAISTRVNATLKYQFYAHAASTALMLLSGWWLIFALNLPLLVVRAVQWKAGVFTVTPSMVTRQGGKGFGILGMTLQNRMLMALVTHAISGIYLVWHLLM